MSLSDNMQCFKAFKYYEQLFSLQLKLYVMSADIQMEGNVTCVSPSFDFSFASEF